MNRLDSLICDVSGLSREVGDVAVGLDPDGALLRATVDDGSAMRVLVLSRDFAQARDALAVRAGTEAPQILIAGVDGDLYLPAFCSAVHAQISLLVSHMPKSLAELDYLATTTASFAHPAGVTFVAGENNKHLNRSHNDVLARTFTKVRGSRGQGKFRCIVGEIRCGGQLAVAESAGGQLGVAENAGGQLTVAEGGSAAKETLVTANSIKIQQSEAGLVGIGGVFSGAKPDAGGEFLASRVTADLETRALADRCDLQILDLGAGNGSVSWDLLFSTNAQVTATDIATDAIVSASKNLERFGSRITVVWDDAASTLEDEAFDVVVLNPPFHRGFAVDSTLVGDLLDAAYRVLKPGGLLYLVHNSHLRYRQQISELFTDVQQLGRNQRFTVVVAGK